MARVNVVADVSVVSAIVAAAAAIGVADVLIQ